MAGTERPPIEMSQIQAAYQLLEPHVDEPRKRMINAAISDWQMAKNHYSLLLEEQTGTLKPALEDVEYGEGQLNLANQHLTDITDFVTQPRRKLAGQLGVLLRGVFRRQHPLITPAQEERVQVESYLTDARKRLMEAEQNHQKAAPMVRSAEGASVTADGRVLGLFDGIAVRDLELTKSYLGIFPYRASHAIERRGGIFYLDQNHVPDLEGFRTTIAPYLKARARIKGYRELASGKLPLVEVPAEELPEPVKEALKGWTSYKFAIELFDAGLLPVEPKLSEFLKT